MKHILFIDQLSKLTLKKDTSLMIALTLKANQIPTWLLFEEDLYWNNLREPLELNVYDFSGSIDPESYYLHDFRLLDKKRIKLEAGDIVHMRIDPPFDLKYLRFLWILKAMKKNGIRVINDPEGILCYNEKLYAYEQKEAMDTYVGRSSQELDLFLNKLKNQGLDEVIMKPLDLYQGIGVEKVSLSHAPRFFLEKTQSLQGPVIVQPFYKEVFKGEIRSIFFNGTELGSILKIPRKGEFLANIARGAHYELVELTLEQSHACQRISKELLNKGINLIAFDILGNYISEVNITCPGLLVEVSSAYKMNLAKKMIDLI